MKVSWSLLLLTLVTTSPLLVADDGIWDTAEEQREQGEQTAASKETEEGSVDRMPSPGVEESAGDANEADDAD